METWKHGELETWTHGHMDTWTHEDLDVEREKSNGRQKLSFVHLLMSKQMELSSC